MRPLPAEKNDSKKQNEKANKPNIVTGFSAAAEIADLEASILNRQGKEQIILASQAPLVPKGPVKQLQGVPVPQAELREPEISVQAAIIANFQLLKIDFLE